MTQKLRFIWEEKNINQELETFDMETDIQGLTNTYFCGRFNRPVIISGIKLETIHFKNLKIINCIMLMLVRMDYFVVLNIQSYNDLSFTIITPGISRNAFCFCIIF